MLTETTLSFTFFANRPGLTYRAETSTDLTNWSSIGVTQTTPGPDGRSTASILRDDSAPHRFLQLKVE